MRVITGTAKGNKLKSLKGMETRPTLDRVKEALFNIIGSRIIDTEFLDLFAGTGAIGIEAISRGANHALFVEVNPRAVQIIRENLEITGFADQGEIMAADVEKALKAAASTDRKFDMIFMDPPYLKELVQKTLTSLMQFGVLTENGLVIVESSKMDELPLQEGPLKMVRQEKYGDTMLTFYQ